MSSDSKSNLLTDLGNAAKVQQHQLKTGASHLSTIDNKLDELNDDQDALNQALLDAIRQADTMLGNNGKLSGLSTVSIDEHSIHQLTKPIDTVDQIDYTKISKADSWEDIVALNDAYAQRQSLNLDSDPYKDLMSVSDRIEFEKWVKEDFTYQNANCDKYDYLIASTCGLIGGLIDIFFVIAPGKGLAGKFTDEMTNKAVEKFAQLNGWKGPREDSDPTASAIGFLERKF